jgi:DNA-directed RNA polymerase subunit RPC12/RpoP
MSETIFSCSKCGQRYPVSMLSDGDLCPRCCGKVVQCSRCKDIIKGEAEVVYHQDKLVCVCAACGRVWV